MKQQIKVLILCWVLLLPGPIQKSAASNTPNAENFTQQHADNLNNEDVEAANDALDTADINTNTEETGGFLKSSIILFAVAFAGIVIAKGCLKKVSSVIFLASALLYIVTEIALFIGFYADANTDVSSYKAQKYNKQIDALNEASQLSSSAGDVAIAKSVAQALVALGFIVAAAMAIIETLLDWPKFTGDCFSTWNDLPKQELYASVKPFLTKLNNFIPIAQVSAADKGGKAAGMIAAMGIGAVAGALIVSAMGTTIGSSFAGIMSNGYTRAAIYGVFAGFATWSAAESGVAASKLKHNSNEFKRLANATKRKTRTNSVDWSKTQAPGDIQQIDPIVVATNKLPSKNGQSVCVQGQDIANDATLDQDCSCKKDNSCLQIKLPNLKANRPNALQFSTIEDSAQTFAESTNSIFAGDLKHSVLNKEKINKAYAAVNKTIDQENWPTKDDRHSKSTWNREKARVRNFINDNTLKFIKKLSPEQRDQFAKFSGAFNGLKKLDNKGKNDNNATTQRTNKTPNTSSLKLDLGRGKQQSAFGRKRKNKFNLLQRSSKTKGRSRSEKQLADRELDIFINITKGYHQHLYPLIIEE